MAKAVWGGLVSFFTAVGVQFISVPESWRWAITIVAGIGFVISVIGFFLSREAQVKESQNIEVVAPKQTGSIVTAGRDIHQTVNYVQQASPTNWKPLELNVVPLSAKTENMSQLGNVISGNAIFHGDLVVGIHNPNVDQAIRPVYVRLLSITPPLFSSNGWSPMTEDNTLRQIKFDMPDIVDGVLEGNQTAYVHILGVTRKPHLKPESLKNINVTIRGTWPITSKNSFTPQAEHVLTLEAVGRGLGVSHAEFLVRFSELLDQPVYTVTKLPPASSPQKDAAQDDHSKTMLTACLDQIARGVSPLRALQNVDAYELDSNEDIERLRSDIIMYTNKDPFEEILFLQGHWLSFLRLAIGLDLGTSQGLLAALDRVNDLPNRLKKLTPPS